MAQSLPTRIATVAAYLFPSIIFVGLVILLELFLPLSFLFSDFLIRGVALSQAILLGAILAETFRLFRGSLAHGPRYVLVASVLAVVLTLEAWPNASILVACAAYAASHAALDAHLHRLRSQRSKLQLDPLLLLGLLVLVVLGAWGTPWAALALLSDVWNDTFLSGQLARSCLWAALGPSLLPVLLLHLAYSLAGFWGLASVGLGLLAVFVIVGNRSPKAFPKKRAEPRGWIAAAFHAGFVPALALLTIAALATWPENIQWGPIFFWVMLLGFGLRIRGWNLKILVSLAWAVLCVQAILESL